MKKTAVLLYPDFSEYELSVALSILMQGGKPIITLGVNNEPIRGESGLGCVVDSLISEVNLADIDSLILPGCMDIACLQQEQEIFDLIRAIHDKEGIIASISSSPYLLAKAGILANKQYTVGLPLDGIKQLGIFDLQLYSDDLVVQDGYIITARGRAFIQFGIHLGNALNLNFNANWYQS
jgi:4-methyl-5(b-hydroxyethyl)-thiazole monophosphate biosynthesis